MIRFAIVPFALILLTCATFAQSSQPSASVATEPTCAGLAKACNHAADELAAARKLILAQESQLQAADQRILVERQKSELAKELAEVLRAQIANLETAILAEREAKDLTKEVAALHEKRAADLEKRLKRSKALNRLALIGGVLAAIFAR